MGARKTAPGEGVAVNEGKGLNEDIDDESQDKMTDLIIDTHPSSSSSSSLASPSQEISSKVC